MRLKNDLVSSFQRILIPSPMRHRKRRRHFQRPMSDLAALLHYIQMDQTMRVGPAESRNRSSERNRFLHVVVRNAMVREGGIWNQCETRGYKKKTYYFAPHETPRPLAISYSIS